MFRSSAIFVTTLGVAASGLIGALAIMTGETIMQEIFGAVFLLIAAVLFVGCEILAVLGRKAPPAATAASGSLEQRLDSIAADVAWFKEVKSKEILRARARAAKEKEQGKG